MRGSLRRLAVVLIACVATANLMSASNSRADACDDVPTGVVTSDYSLDFTVPVGLMPDPQYDGRPAELDVHRVQPVYSHGECADVLNRAAVLIHGRTTTGPVAFDLRQRAPGGESLSVQEGLALAGIDTFAPSLLGYGRSTRFGMDDPANASVRAYESDGTTCNYQADGGCDRTNNPIWSLDQQGTALFVNPLAGQRRPHSSNVRFARTDVWVRDVRQVIDDAITRAQPTDGKVTLVGYSLGANRVGRTLYAANPVLPNSAATIAKVNRVVFLSPFFGGPTEEAPGSSPTFPLSALPAANQLTTFAMPPGRDEVCTGHVVQRAPEQIEAQVREQDAIGRDWGGDDSAHPTGVNRTPTFSTYGWNPAVAAQLSAPTLVMQGLDDTGVPGGAGTATAVYNALPASMTNKVLVQIGCASHGMLVEGCLGARCRPSSGTPYGGEAGQPWRGPHATVKAALIEWITNGTFNGAPGGRFTVTESGVATAST